MITLRQVADRARYHADQRNSSYTTDEEMLELITDNYTELYDLIVAAFGENYYSSSDTFAISSATATYALPEDFYKIIGVDFQVNTGAYITLKAYTELERNRSLTTNTALPSGNIRLRYVPAPQIFTSLDDEIDGVAGWDRLLTLSVAIDLMDSEESDTAALTKKFNRTYKRIDDMSKNRDQTMPGRVGDIHYSNIINTYGALMYRLYGDNIELMSTEFLGADAFPQMF
jgi:hypothetical protein